MVHLIYDKSIIIFRVLFFQERSSFLVRLTRLAWQIRLNLPESYLTTDKSTDDELLIYSSINLINFHDSKEIYSAD